MAACLYSETMLGLLQARLVYGYHGWTVRVLYAGRVKSAAREWRLASSFILAGKLSNQIRLDPERTTDRKAPVGRTD